MGLPEFILQHPKRLSRDAGAPVLSQFGMWSDSTQNAIYIQGGHFLAAPPWNESAYYVPKQEIPENSIWRFDVLTEEWKDMTGEILGDRETVRTFGGAACSVPALNQSFWLGLVITTFALRLPCTNWFSTQLLLIQLQLSCLNTDSIFKQTAALGTLTPRPLRRQTLPLRRVSSLSMTTLRGE